ncbi:MAG: sigma-70 family RNA polymerase sigma factor [bacterium]|nr:sigma-70 family RNA polymerase sigma factor [bacterium]
MLDRPVPGEVTRVLQRVDAGDRDAVGDLLPLVYNELRALAQAEMAGERANHTLQPTALVNEACIRLMGQERAGWENRRHFYRAAATVMRHILVNHARDRRRLKRGGQFQRLPFEEALAAYDDRAIDLVELDDALSRLETVEPRAVDVIELRFFGGLTVNETAEMLGVSARTVQSDWNLARVWLLREISSD